MRSLCEFISFGFDFAFGSELELGHWNWARERDRGEGEGAAADLQFCRRAFAGWISTRSRISNRDSVRVP